LKEEPFLFAFEFMGDFNSDVKVILGNTGFHEYAA
jgi:hypothetical protein